MGLRVAFKSGGRLKSVALSLLMLSILCYALELTSTFQPGPRDPARATVYLKSVLLHTQPANTTDEPGTATFDPSTDRDYRRPHLLAVQKWNFTGSMDLNYPLNVDMPEIVRLIMLNQSVNYEPINKPDFPILHSNADLCEQSSRDRNAQPDLLILIKSAPANFMQRDTIRLTWGSEKCWGGRHVVKLFLLGVASSLDNQSTARLDEEIAYNKDIIQQDFVDQYHNNTYKLLFGIDWAVRYCPTAPMLMFVDDDFFVYPRNVISFLESISSGLKERLIAGYVWHNAIPVRPNVKGPKKKWAISWDEFPSRMYPPYVAAGNFFVSMQLAKELRIASWFTRYLRFDDVFLGILLKKLVRTPMHLPNVYAFSPVKVKSVNEVNNMISSHDFRIPTSVLNLWDRLNCRDFCLDETN